MNKDLIDKFLYIQTNYIILFDIIQQKVKPRINREIKL